MMTREWKDGLAEALENLLCGRPHLIVVYDEPRTELPREPWKIKPNVPFFVRSTVARSDVETVLGHIREVSRHRLLGESTRTVSNICFEVEYLDQVNEGREVWANRNEGIETEENAKEEAVHASECELKRSKLVRVTREVLAEFEDGKEVTL